MRISFVMLCYNNWPTTDRALQSLRMSLDAEPLSDEFEVVLVDNGSTDDTVTCGPQEIQGLPCHATYLRIPENLGIPFGMNTGFGAARGDIIAFLNNDLVFPEGWLGAILEALGADRSLGLAVPLLTYTSVPEQMVNPDFSHLDEMPIFARDVMARTRGRVTPVNRVITSCVVFRRDLLDTIGGLDLWFGLGSLEDSDWSLRAEAAGYHNAVIGGSFVYHQGSLTYHQIPGFEHIYQTNGAKFLRKVGRLCQPFSRASHYIPVTLDDFSSPESSPRRSDDVLLVADWTHASSQWASVLCRWKQADDITAWIPAQYFDPNEVVPRVREAAASCGIGSGQLNILTTELAAVDWLSFIMQFGQVAEVPGDAVNRAIRFLRKGYVEAKRKKNG